MTSRWVTVEEPESSKDPCYFTLHLVVISQKAPHSMRRRDRRDRRHRQRLLRLLPALRTTTPTTTTTPAPTNGGLMPWNREIRDFSKFAKEQCIAGGQTWARRCRCRFRPLFQNLPFWLHRYSRHLLHAQRRGWRILPATHWVVFLKLMYKHFFSVSPLLSNFIVIIRIKWLQFESFTLSLDLTK